MKWKIASVEEVRGLYPETRLTIRSERAEDVAVVVAEVAALLNEDRYHAAIRGVLTEVVDAVDYLMTERARVYGGPKVMTPQERDGIAANVYRGFGLTPDGKRA